MAGEMKVADLVGVLSFKLDERSKKIVDNALLEMDKQAKKRARLMGSRTLAENFGPGLLKMGGMIGKAGMVVGAGFAVGLKDALDFDRALT